MRAELLLKRLMEVESKGIILLTKHDIEKLFPDDEPAALTLAIHRLSTGDAPPLLHVARGLYALPEAIRRNGLFMDHLIAIKLRPGHLSYVSLESALSEYGLISQIPVGVLTVMTTGRRGWARTAFGDIEFVHTERSYGDILDSTFKGEQMPLRYATAKTALRDLRKVGRNLDMLDHEAIDRLSGELDLSKQEHEKWQPPLKTSPI